MQTDTLIKLLAVFVPLSLAAIGGAPSIFASIHHESVEVQHWITAREFLELFAVSRGAPGPGSMLVTLIGWKAAGFLGALVATLALYVPSSLITLAVAKVWGKYSGRPWHSAVQRGLAPVGTGLMAAGIFAIFKTAGAGPLSWIVALGSALLLGALPKLHPLVLLVAGALIFVAWNRLGAI
ncbi:MAG TPA: chromate transporter [Dongiaceae bacterium]|jgi:chromate transporter|nr:chromate transporter [Dongiaceae bacterium]